MTHTSLPISHLLTPTIKRRAAELKGEPGYLMEYNLLASNLKNTRVLGNLPEIRPPSYDDFMLKIAAECTRKWISPYEKDFSQRTATIFEELVALQPALPPTLSSMEEYYEVAHRPKGPQKLLPPQTIEERLVDEAGVSGALQIAQTQRDPTLAQKISEIMANRAKPLLAQGKTRPDTLFDERYKPSEHSR